MVPCFQVSDFDLAPKGVIYRDLRVFIRLQFSSVLFSHVPHTCNKIAHALGAFGANRPTSRQLWQEALPIDLHVPVTSTLAKSRV
jgi:hypothetical protein